MIADREGRMEDRPKRIKADLLPHDSVDVEPLLAELAARKFIIRYEVDGKKFILIPTFTEHQAPHIREQASTIPEPPKQEQSTTKVVPSTNLGSDIPSPRSPDSHDSLNPSSHDSLIVGSLNLGSENKKESKPLQSALPTATKKKAPLTAEETALKAVCRATWESYSRAYNDRYNAMPTGNATVYAQLKQFCKRVPGVEAPHIAAFYCRHNAAFYVTKGHAVGQLLADAEKLRTEWATNRTITATQAQQSDRTQANGNIFGKLIAEAKERERNEANQQAV